MSTDMSGKTVFITGAARGIGAESARRLSKLGANVALIGLEPIELHEVARECGPNALAIECDVTDVAALEDAVAQTVARFGSIYSVVANAGIAPMGMTHSMDPNVFERTIEINLLGVWRTVRACLPEIIRTKGYVLIVSSAAAALHMPGMSAYCASKAGVEAFADSLALEMLAHDVAVGCVYYNWIATDMVKSADLTPLGAYMRGKLPGVLGKQYPVSEASDAMVAGIIGRKRRVMAPSWLHVMLPLRWWASRIAAPIMRPIVRKANVIADAENARLGVVAASAPMGAGGQAAMDALKTR